MVLNDNNRLLLGWNKQICYISRQERKHNNEKGKTMKINLTQKEAQALLLSANEMLDEVSKLDAEHRLSVGWRIMLKDFKSGIIKLHTQYFKQLEEDK